MRTDIPRLWNLSAAVTLLILAAAAGCTQSETPDNRSNSDKTTGDMPKSATEAGDKLVGVWLGQPTLNEAMLETKLQQKNPAEQAKLLEEARQFASIVVAMDFRHGGQMEHEVEVSPDGKSLMREAGRGTWRVIAAEGNAMDIETTEHLKDGTQVTTNSRYEFDAARDRFAVQIPVSRDLADCQAKLLFQRQQLTDNNMASNPAGTEQK